MPAKDERKIAATMRRKRAKGQKIRKPKAYKYGTLRIIKKRRAAKRRRSR